MLNIPQKGVYSVGPPQETFKNLRANRYNFESLGENVGNPKSFSLYISNCFRKSPSNNHWMSPVATSHWTPLCHTVVHFCLHFTILTPQQQIIFFLTLTPQHSNFFSWRHKILLLTPADLKNYLALPQYKNAFNILCAYNINYVCICIWYVDRYILLPSPHVFFFTKYKDMSLTQQFCIPATPCLLIMSGKEAPFQIVWKCLFVLILLPLPISSISFKRWRYLGDTATPRHLAFSNPLKTPSPINPSPLTHPQPTYLKQILTSDL